MTWATLDQFREAADAAWRDTFNASVPARMWRRMVRRAINGDLFRPLPRLRGVRGRARSIRWKR